MENILNTIERPQDIKPLKEKELKQLSEEIRETLVKTVSKNGGHLASNLGVVELTMALHKVFNSPYDKIIWDVGHQVYTHKLLTGRRDKFDTLRKEGGISGFSRPNESEHDIVYSGHSSTSVSTAMGIAVANKIKANKNFTIAVLGDGALTGGLVYEAFNNAGAHKGIKLIVILNDNAMSISPNVGVLAKYLAVIRSKKGYFRMKAATERFLNKIPLIGKPTSKMLFRVKTSVKNMIYKSNFFEDMDFRYMGPIDGHDIHTLTEALEGAKIVNGPVLLHVKTIKGKGYNPAEQMPSQFHGCPKFDPETGEFSSECDSFSNKFGEFLRLQAAKDKRICAITAAMSLGTGLKGFSKEYPDRFFDVGIAEEHALPYALGLSESGMLPVFVVYSTFLQRCFDQIIHDAALQNRKIIIAVDRAGITGDDGETHQGIYDVSLLNGIPNITVFAPTYFSQLNGFLVQALYHTNGVIAVRYPRGSEPNFPDEYTPTTENYETYLKKDSEVAIVTYGRLFPYACDAAKRLRKKGISACVIKLNRIKPIDEEAIKECLGKKKIYFFEEGIKSGGAGESFSRMLLEWAYKGRFTLKAFDNCFVEQGDVESQLHKYGLDTDGMYSLITQDGGNADE